MLPSPAAGPKPRNAKSPLYSGETPPNSRDPGHSKSMDRPPRDFGAARRRYPRLQTRFGHRRGAGDGGAGQGRDDRLLNLFPDPHGRVRPVGDEEVDAPQHEPAHLGLVVDGPDGDGLPGLVEGGKAAQVEGILLDVEP